MFAAAPTMMPATIRLGPISRRRRLPLVSSTIAYHSFRHTYARIALENGAELSWLSRQLGHSSAAFTEQRYGHWSARGRERQMERLADAFAF